MTMRGPQPPTRVLEIQLRRFVHTVFLLAVLLVVLMEVLIGVIREDLVENRLVAHNLCNIVFYLDSIRIQK